jgi:hypothetical protein
MAAALMARTKVFSVFMFLSPFSVSQVCLTDALINARATPKVHRTAGFAQRIEMSHNWVQQDAFGRRCWLGSVYLPVNPGSKR